MKAEKKESGAGSLISKLLLPVYMYSFWVMFNHPAGWLAINMLVPMKAIYEYSHVHKNILNFILNSDQKVNKSDNDKKKRALLQQLIEYISNSPTTMMMMVLFHLSVMSFSANTIGFVLVFLYVFIILMTLHKFNKFMNNPTEDIQAVFKQNDFQRDALILTCISLFLEIFCQIFLSLGSSLSYLIYIMQSKFILILVILSSMAEFTKQMTGNCFGKQPFAKYVAPFMQMEGVALTIFTTTSTSYGLYFLSTTEYNKWMVHTSIECYLIIGFMTGYLSIMGSLLICFLKRCSTVSSHPNLKYKNAFLQIWNEFKVLDFVGGMILPTNFLIWYIFTFKQDTFDNNPGTVSMFKLIREYQF